jgi:hypothetical protein
MDPEMAAYYTTRDRWWWGYYVELAIACVTPVLLLRHYADP